MTHYAMHHSLKDFGKALGVAENLQLAEGVLTLRDNEGTPWTLQCSDEASLLVLYSPLAAEDGANQQDWESWLRLNSRFDILRGAWIGLHPDNHMCCLFASIPLAVLTGPLLYNLFMNLREVRSDLALRLLEPQFS